MRDSEKPGNAHGEVSDLVVDRLLLRYLFYHVNGAQPTIQFSLTW